MSDPVAISVIMDDPSPARIDAVIHDDDGPIGIGVVEFVGLPGTNGTDATVTAANIAAALGYTPAPSSTVSFPGFGTDHAHAAYGDHAHTGTYDPAGAAAAITLSGLGGITPGTTLAHYGITDAAPSSTVSFPGFGTDHAHAAYGDHAHGNISSAGKIGTTANLPVITGTGGEVTVGSFGSDANTFCAGDDSRVSGALNTTTGDVRYGLWFTSTTPRTRTTANAYALDEDCRVTLDANSWYLIEITFNHTNSDASGTGVACRLSYSGTINGANYTVGATSINVSGLGYSRFPTVTAGSVSEAVSNYITTSQKLVILFPTGTSGVFALSLANPRAASTMTRTGIAMYVKKL